MRIVGGVAEDDRGLSSEQGEPDGDTGAIEVSSLFNPKIDVGTSVNGVEGARQSHSASTTKLADIKHFDIASDVSDHHFAGETAQVHGPFTLTASLERCILCRGLRHQC
jgi:hypothetical protein